MKITIVGTGNLGKSIAKGLLENNLITELTLTRRNLQGLAHFESYKNVVLTSDNQSAVQSADIIIFALQPAAFEEVLRECASLFTERHILISTITGFAISKIEGVIGSGHTVIRAMPNTAISVGKSMTCLCANAKGEKRIPVAEAIFEGLGHTLIIPEKQMQAATVICASGIAFWMRLIRASTQAAIQLGFDAEEAQELSMYTCEGAAQLLISNGHHPEREIDRVTTPMGCTIEGLNEMEYKGLSSALIKGMLASFQKISSIKEDQV